MPLKLTFDDTIQYIFFRSHYCEGKMRNVMKNVTNDIITTMLVVVSTYVD